MVKNPPVNGGDARDICSILGSGRSSGGGKGNPLQYYNLGNAMDRVAWEATVHWVAESDTTEHSCKHTKKIYSGQLLFPWDKLRCTKCNFLYFLIPSLFLKSDTTE